MSANADYGVSIVESFIPPKNMIPGEEVNKDVYAVNTGNIGAFVKETIKTKLTYTYEKKVATAPDQETNPTEAAKYVELDANVVRSIDGATSQEAGGYLAYTTAPGVELGVVNSATARDTAQSATGADAPGAVEGTRWTPPATGVYIFKRSIDTTDPAAPKYTYAGYYFVKGSGTDDVTTLDVDESGDKYYKIVVGDDAFRANDSLEADGQTAKFEFDITFSENNVTSANSATIKRENGQIEGTVPVMFVKDKTVTNVTPTLTYHKTGDKGVAYLDATYTDGEATTDPASLAAKEQAVKDAQADVDAKYTAYLQKLSTAAEKEPAYENALGDYNSAVSRYKQTKADYDYALALENATNAIYQAADDRAQAELRMETAKNNMLKAYHKMMDEWIHINQEDGTATNTSTDKFGYIYNTTNGLAGTESAGTGTNDSCDISFKTIFGSNVANLDTTALPAGTATTSIDYILKNNTTGTTADLQLMQTIKTYRTLMQEKWGQIRTAAGELETAMKKYTSLNPENLNDPTTAENYRKDMLEKQAALSTLLGQYKDLYADLTNVVDQATPANVTEDLLTNLKSATTGIETKIGTWKTYVDALRTATDDENDATKLRKLIADYNTKYNTYRTEITANIPAAEKDWAKAVNDYNTAVSGAKTTYRGEIYKNQITEDAQGNLAKNNYEGLKAPNDANVVAPYYNSTYGDVQSGEGRNVVRYLTNNEKEIVKLYSSQKENSDDPTLGDTYVNTDKTLTTTGKDLWKSIGKDTSGTVKGTTKAAKFEDDTADTVTYSYYPDPTVPGSTQSYSKHKYTPADNGDDIADESAFKQVGVAAGTAKTLGTLNDAVTTKLNALGTDATDTSKPYGDYMAAQQALETAAETLTNAQKVLNAANSNYTAEQQNDSTIAFKIYLDDNDPGLEWTSELADGESAEEASFYYNYILQPGETSHKLVDAVEFSNTVGSKDYKDLTLDLDVNLASAQITYADDQKTITDTAVKANSDDFKLAIKEGDGINQTTGELKWVSKTGETPEYIYFMGNTRVEPISIADKELPIGSAGATETKTFKYTITDGSKTYYGTSLTGDYYEANDASNPTFVKTPAVTVMAVTPGTPTETPATVDKATYTYKFGDDVVTPEAKTKTMGTTTYKYRVTTSDGTYYGVDTKNGTKYYKYDPATDTVDTENASTTGQTLTATKTTYTLGGTAISASDIVDAGTFEDTDVRFDKTKKITLDGVDYYGTSANDGENNFYAYTPATETEAASLATEPTVLAIATTNII